MPPAAGCRSCRALLHPGRVIAKDFAKYALPVVCNECLWSLAFSLYTVIMGHMDNNTPILSAYTIAGNLQRMMTPASFAAGGAAAVLIGGEIGRGNRGSVQRKAWVLDALALVVGFVCMGIIALVRNVLLRPYILPLMHMEGEACDIAMYMMGILMLVQPVSSVSLTNIVGVLRGGGDVRYAMLCDVRAAVRRVPAAGGARGAGVEARHPVCVPAHVDRCDRADLFGVSRGCAPAGGSTM